MMNEQNKLGINEKAGLFLLIAFMGVGLALGSTLSLLVWRAMGGKGLTDMQLALSNSSHINFIRLTQTVLAACIFFFSSLLAVRMVSKKPFTYIGFTAHIQVKTILWGCLLMGVTIVLSGSLATLNEMIPLSESLKIYFKSMEDAYSSQVDLMSKMTGINDLVVSLLVMALAPALFEEVFFRGGFQNMMFRATGKMWTSILVTSLLFSAIHFSFYGFLSRIALSIVLGLLYAYTKNIWMAIIPHFLNNALGVFQIYYLRMKGLPLSEGTEDKYPLWWALISLTALVILFRYFKKSLDGIR